MDPLDTYAARFDAMLSNMLGAPLDGAADAVTGECAYCHTPSETVRRRRTPDGPTPPLCPDCWLDVQDAQRAVRREQ